MPSANPNHHAPSRDEIAAREAIERGVFLPGSRLPAPEGMTDAERAEWNAIILNTPPGWIGREHEGLFRDLIRHNLIAKQLGEKIAKTLPEINHLPLDDPQWQALRDLSVVYRAESEQCVKLARALRLTRQSQREPRAAGTAFKKSTAKPKPWNDWGVDRPGAAKSQ